MLQSGWLSNSELRNVYARKCSYLFYHVATLIYKGTLRNSWLKQNKTLYNWIPTNINENNKNVSRQWKVLPLREQKRNKCKQVWLFITVTCNLWVVARLFVWGRVLLPKRVQLFTLLWCNLKVIFILLTYVYYKSKLYILQSEMLLINEIPLLSSDFWSRNLICSI